MGKCARRCGSVVLAFLALTTASGAPAVDGVIEISQARALAGGINGDIGLDPPGFPIVITERGSYRLTGELDVSGFPNSDAIAVSADFVSLDLNGFGIVGAGSGTGRGIFGLAPWGNAATVRNGYITSMGASGVVLGNDAHIERLLVDGSGVDGIAIGLGGLVLANRVVGSGSRGLALGVDSAYRDNQLAANAIPVEGGVALGGNLCGGSLCGPTGGGQAATLLDEQGQPLPQRGNVQLMGALMKFEDDPASDTTRISFDEYDEPFTVVLIGDTQGYTFCKKTRPDYVHFFNIADWIVANEDRYNIKFVVQLGDIVENGDGGRAGLPGTQQWDCAAEAQNVGSGADTCFGGVPGRDCEWTRASNAMAIIEGAGIPSIVIPGNHDFDGDADDFDRFLNWFGPSRYAGSAYYKDFLVTGANEAYSSYQLFEASGREWLHIGLAYDPPAEHRAWAEQVMRDHPGVPTVVSSHSIFNVLRHLISQTQAFWFPCPQQQSTGWMECKESQYIWPQVARQPQLWGLFAGHAVGNHHTMQTHPEGGQNVIGILTAYSTGYWGGPWMVERSGGGSLLTLLHVYPAENRVEVQTYAVSYDEWLETQDYRYGFDLDFLSRYGSARFGTQSAPRLLNTDFSLRDSCSGAWFVENLGPDGWSSDFCSATSQDGSNDPSVVGGNWVVSESTAQRVEGAPMGALAAGADPSNGADYLSVPDSGAFEAPSFSMCGFVRPNGGTTPEVFAQKGETGAHWSVRLVGDVAGFEVGSSLVLTSSGALSPDAWHHLCATYDGSGDNQLRLWVDGVQRASALASSDPAAEPVASAAELWVSANSGLALGAWLAETAYFAETLDAQEICALCRFGLRGNYSDRGSRCDCFQVP